ncbi:MAG: hypothetical protein MUF00_11975, partial [Gemmatimonadaceae bacterium]|nr:hypothetical protein [Gemmatimonadaceae bacterium]
MATDTALVGLWGAEPMLGPQVRGTVLLQQHASHWSLRVAGFESSASARGDSVVFELPGGQGLLRVWLTAGTPDAFWVQPAGIDQSFATPVPLRAAGTRRWVGTVAPINTTFPLYLAITRGDDGSLRGVFRNPVQNWSGRVPFYHVTRDGDALSFTHPRTGTVQWRQPYDAGRRTISFDFGVPIVLTPRRLTQVVGYVARTGATAHDTYRQPVALRDGWTVQHAARAGLDTATLALIVHTLATVDPLDESQPRVHGVLMARHGKLVLEEYFRGYS